MDNNQTEHNENIFASRCFDEWKHDVTTRQSDLIHHKLIFPEEIRGVVNGYMTSPIGCTNGVLLISQAKTVGSVGEAIAYLGEQKRLFDVYLYQMFVCGDTGSITIRFAKMEKHAG